MWFWILFVLFCLFAYGWAGLCVFIGIATADSRKSNDDFGIKVFVFFLCLFFWPATPIVAALAKD